MYPCWPSWLIGVAVIGVGAPVKPPCCPLGRSIKYGWLLGAFDGCDRFPRAFVNLRGGAVRNGRQEQCTAGVGTLLLELGVLSRLTGEPRFEAVVLQTFFG